MRSCGLFLLAALVLLAALSSSGSRRHRHKPKHLEVQQLATETSEHRKQRPVPEMYEGHGKRKTKGKRSKSKKSKHHRHHKQAPEIPGYDDIETTIDPIDSPIDSPIDASTDAPEIPGYDDIHIDPIDSPIDSPTDAPELPPKLPPKLPTHQPTTSPKPIFPTSKPVWAEGKMFWVSKFVTCPHNKELKCRDSGCGQITCPFSEIYSERICPRVPAPCKDLFCGCANSQGYFLMLKDHSKPRCVKQAFCGAKKYQWQNLDKINSNSPVEQHWFNAGTDVTKVYVMRTLYKGGVYPGTLDIHSKSSSGQILDEYKNKIRIPEGSLGKVEVLCDPLGVLQWKRVKKDDIIPVNAIQAGWSKHGVPQYIGKVTIGRTSTVGVGRVEFGKLYYSAGTAGVDTFDILCVPIFLGEKKKED